MLPTYLQDSYKSALFTLQFEVQDFGHNMYLKLTFAFHLTTVLKYKITCIFAGC